MKRSLTPAVLALALVTASCGESGPAALTVPQYQALLTGVEQAVHPLLDRIASAPSLDEVNKVRAELTAVLKAKHEELKAVKPPAEAVPHHGLVRRYTEAHTELASPVKDLAVNECEVGPTPEASRYEGLRVTHRELASRTSSDLGRALSGAGLKFGERLNVPEPKAPEVRTNRAGNGEVVQRSGPKGSTKLTIDNGGEADVAVAAVAGDPNNPKATIYVRAKSKAVLTGLGGAYDVYYKSGEDWDPKRRGFNRGCAFAKFDEPFTSGSNWEITLKTVAGNASTSEVDAF
ncbi:hypothetical protein JOF53_000092 [Crossiella equi]|uniref:Uncharacterized protein n=1 Tax=Crossiella equi TaxID=130796 RepID=A0ABS5A671_9PSEU|nr:hypothetical protein [Crossiella equi]MBP2471220.1 hypothetical protein [Crossiella equi]